MIFFHRDAMPYFFASSFTSGTMLIPIMSSKLMKNGTFPWRPAYGELGLSQI